MERYIETLLKGNSLSREESYSLQAGLQDAPREQQAAILALLRVKGETVDELLGAQDFLLKHAPQVECPFDAIDMVGTGGDKSGTFNISTASSLIVASCGVWVAKHGGRSSTSQSGSMDVVECLGLRPMDTLEAVKASLHSHRYAYLSAPLFNQALKSFGPLRKALGFPTLFNIVGPLVNPLQLKRQVIGVYCKDLIKKVSEVLKINGSCHALVVHSEDGLDELSISAPTHMAELKDGKIEEYVVDPSEVGLPFASLHEVKGGAPRENAKIIRRILSGDIQGPPFDILVLNSAAGLLVADKVKNLREGVKLARDAIVSGKAQALLNKLTQREPS